MPPKKNFYVVKKGRQPGIYFSWTECQQQVDGFPGAVYRGFVTRQEADEWMHAGRRSESMQRPQQQEQRAASSGGSPGYFELADDHDEIAIAMGVQRQIELKQLQQKQNELVKKMQNQHTSRQDQSMSLNDRFTHHITSPQQQPPQQQRHTVVYAESSPQRHHQHTPNQRSHAAPYQRQGYHTAAASHSSSPPAAAAASSAPAAASSSSSSPSSPYYGVLFCDGAAKGNPNGPIGCGGLIYEASASSSSTPSKCLSTFKKYLGSSGSNNESEYYGMIHGMKIATSLGITHLTIKLDSELVAKQMCGDYRVKAQNLAVLHAEALELARGFERCNVQHVYREENALADKLANEAISEHRGY